MFYSKFVTICIEVAIGICFAISTSYVFKQNISIFKFNIPPDLPDCERLLFVFRCLAFSALPLLGAVFNVFRFRGKYLETLGADPLAPVAHSLRGFKTSERILQNTLEQSALHVFAVLALASCVDVDQLYIIPCLVLLFNSGRLSFAVGYHYNPLYRSFGFAVTFFPTLAGFAYAFFTIASRGLTI
eukprot:XP_011662413.1 PREDICTED: transmembrane protein 79-like [Strongylocentrotus purpuratus]